jgi:D-arabinose 1-dehydrogenase-like Zn-dependent alcohol dehydrogenase
MIWVSQPYPSIQPIGAAMPTMRAVQVSSDKQFELVQREIPTPGPGQVRVKVDACGVCHSDAMTKEALFPGLQLPRVPGHEIAGSIDALGPGISHVAVGQRVGVGWHGGHCGHCPSCRAGDFVLCSSLQVPGISYDGGYAEYMVAPVETLATIPDDLDAVNAAPLLCAGVTTFNALRNSGARPGDLVAIQGIGGLGHLGVQFAAKMGFRTVAIARGTDKEAEARKLGAHHYVDAAAGSVAEALQALGGAKVVLSTVTSGAAMTAAFGGLGPGGKLFIVGVAFDPIEVSSVLAIMGRRSVHGWPSGTSLDSQDTLAFSALQGIRPMIETMPLERAPEAYARMMKGDARFRMVLTM